ncbi:MAG: metal-dependent hydrolase [Chloroflexi bacterium]|nr:metal-dependent hydrolase [Chloroflexota bacterium]
MFGHAGITIGMAMIADALTSRQRANVTPAATDNHGDRRSRAGWRGFLPIREWMDYRLLLVASLLPDIIDKPLGQALLRDTFSYGRIHAHTFLFALITGIPGLWLFRTRRRSWLLILAFGSLMHDLEDQMWRWPSVMWWPLKGWAFPREDLNGWFGNMLQALISDPEAFVPELIGIGFLVFAAVRVFHTRRFLYALKTGRLDHPAAQVTR